MTRFFQATQNEGVRISVVTDEDMSAATGGRFEVTKPDGSTVTWPATLQHPAPSGEAYELYYITAPADFDLPGEYLIQAVWTGPGLDLADRPVVVRVYARGEPWE